MTQEIYAKWGNAVIRTITVKQNGEPLDLTDYSLVCTIKRTLKRDDDENAIIKVNLTVEEDQITKKGKANLIITKEQNKIQDGVYYGDIKLFTPGGEPQNTSIFNYVLKNTVGKDD